MAARVVLGVQYGYESRMSRGSRPLRTTNRLDQQLRHRPFDTATIEEEFGDQLREAFAMQDFPDPQDIPRDLTLTPVEPMDAEESEDAVAVENGGRSPVWKMHSGGSSSSSQSNKKFAGAEPAMGCAEQPVAFPAEELGPRQSAQSEGTALVEPSPWLISPGSRPKVCWDLVVTAMVIFSVIEMPFRIGFSVASSTPMVICDVVFDTCFVLDIVLTFCTGYFNECEVYVTNRRDIALRYLRGFFVIDVVSVLPIDHVVEVLRKNNAEGDDPRIFRVLRLLRLAKLARLGRLRRLTELLERHLHMHTLTMLKVMGKVVFLIHMLTCFCYWMSPPCPGGMSEPCANRESDASTEDRNWGDSGVTWVRMFHIDELPDLGSRYLASFHMVTATLMAVGYGDLHPASTPERLFSIFVQLTGAIIFGFILSGVTNVIESSNPRGVERKKRNAEIKEWLRSRNLPPALRQGVWRHFQYLMTQRSIFKDEPEILRNIPTSLRNTIVEQICLQYVQKLQRIFGQEDRSLIAELAVLLQPLQVAYGECVVEAGEPPTDLFTVNTGTIEGLLDEESIMDLEELQRAGTRSIPGLDRNAPVPPSADRGAGLLTPEQSQTTPARYTQMGSATSKRPLPHRRGTAEALSPTGLRNNLPFARLKSQSRSDVDADPASELVLCAIYQEAEALSDFPVNPVRLQGGDRRSELLALNKELLHNALMQFPGACERYTAKQRDVQVQLWEACISSELQRMRSPVHGTKARRMKSKILIGGEATEVSRLNPEVFSYMRLDELKFEQVFATRTFDPKSGTKKTNNETDLEVLQRYIVPPHHYRKVQWDIFVGMLVLYSVMVIPFRFGFKLVKRDALSEVIDYLVDILFFVDICLSFRTGFLDSEGGVNTIPSDIRNRYIRGWFLIDVFSTFPLYDIVDAIAPAAKNEFGATRLLKFSQLLRMLKMARVIKMARLSTIAESSVDVSTTMIRLMGMCTKIFVPAHILACFWFYFYWINENYDGNYPCAFGMSKCLDEVAPSAAHWVDVQERKYQADFTYDGHNASYTADTDTIVNKYVISLYWVFTTMTTVGYGDVVPTNNMERAFAVCVMLFGATVFGYIIGTIAEMSNEHNRDALGINMSLLRHYGTEQHFSEHTQGLMRFHYDFWYQEMTPQHYESSLLAKLPPALRKEVITFIHRNVISSIPLFRKKLPEWFVAASVRLLEPQAFMASEVIIGSVQAGPRQDVFFVHEGICESYLLPNNAGSTTFRSGTRRSNRTANQKVEGSCVCGSGCEDECPGRLLDVYPPGSAFGYEFILQESSFAPFCEHKKMLVRCSPAGPCFAYALRHGTLADINRHYPEFGQVVQEVLGDTILREGRRWHKARKRREVWLEDYETSAPWLQPSSKRRPRSSSGSCDNSAPVALAPGREEDDLSVEAFAENNVEVRELTPPGAVPHTVMGSMGNN